MTTKPNELIDHITLEKDFVRWDATILTAQGDKATKFPSQRTRQVEKNLIFWFALCIRTPSILEMAPATLTLGPFAVVSSDSKRRAESALMAREGAVFVITQLHENETLSNDAFVTFEIWVDLRALKEQHDVVVPIAPPAVTKQLILPKQLLYRAHDVKIPGLRDRFGVNVYKLVGTLEQEAVFCGDARPSVSNH